MIDSVQNAGGMFRRSRCRDSPRCRSWTTCSSETGTTSIGCIASCAFMKRSGRRGGVRILRAGGIPNHVPGRFTAGKESFFEGSGGKPSDDTEAAGRGRTVACVVEESNWLIADFEEVPIEI